MLLLLDNKSLQREVPTTPLSFLVLCMSVYYTCHGTNAIPKILLFTFSLANLWKDLYQNEQWVCT